MSSSAAASSASASSTSAAAIPTADDLTCPSCQCIIAHPLRLNCAHHLCKECVKQWTQHSRDIAAKVVENSVELLGLTESNLAKFQKNPQCDLGDRCDFCQLEESDNNALVWCDGCPAVVHQGCYQIAQMPAKDEDWFCDPCSDAMQKEQKERKKNNKASPQKVASSASGGQKKKKKGSSSNRQPPECCVCRNTDDRVMKRVLGGGYIHLSCASFLDGPDFLIKDDRTVITNVSTISQDWFKLSCKFCTKRNGEKTSFGAKVQCRYKKCCTSYHVPCGLQNGALFSIKELGEHIYKDNVCVVHRKHIREIANAHDEKLAPVKGKKIKGKSRKQKPKGVKMPCPVCRNECNIVLGKENLGLQYDEEMAQQAKAYREAHPDEDDDLDDVLAKYPKSRGHDDDSSSSSSSSSSESESEQEEELEEREEENKNTMEEDDDDVAGKQSSFRSSQEEADLAHPDRRKSPRKQPSRQSSTASSIALTSSSIAPASKSRLQKRASSAFTPPPETESKDFSDSSHSPSPPFRAVSASRASPAAGAHGSGSSSSPRKRASTPLTPSSSLERLSSPSPSPSALKPKKLMSEDDQPLKTFNSSAGASSSSKPLALSVAASSSNAVSSPSPMSGKRARHQPATFKDSVNFMDIDSEIDDSSSEEEDEDAYARQPKKKKSRLAVTPQPSNLSDLNKTRAPNYVPDMRRSHSDPELQLGLEALTPKPKTSSKYDKFPSAVAAPATSSPVLSKNSSSLNPLSSSKMPLFSPRKTMLELEEDGLEILDFKVPQPFKKSAVKPVVPVPTAQEVQAKYKALFGSKTNTSPEVQPTKIQPTKPAFPALPLSKAPPSSSPANASTNVASSQLKTQQLLRQQQFQLLQPASMRKQSAVPLPMKTPSSLPLPTSDSDSEDFDQTAQRSRQQQQQRAFIEIDSSSSSDKDEEMN